MCCNLLEGQELSFFYPRDFLEIFILEVEVSSPSQVVAPALEGIL